MNYNGQNETITIKQLLAQTSGIPSDITSEDAVTNKNNRLNDVTRAIMGDELHHKPGEEFEYSNMNYDLLGLIIQNVTKQSYTKYITNSWLKPLHMTHTSFKQTNNKSKMMLLATNYKVRHLSSLNLNLTFGIHHQHI